MRPRSGAQSGHSHLPAIFAVSRVCSMAGATISAPLGQAGIDQPVEIERPDFQIVPRRGLLIVTVPLVMVIVAIAANKLWPLVFLHVAFVASFIVVGVMAVIALRLLEPAQSLCSSS